MENELEYLVISSPKISSIFIHYLRQSNTTLVCVNSDLCIDYLSHEFIQLFI